MTATGGHPALRRRYPGGKEPRTAKTPGGRLSRASELLPPYACAARCVAASSASSDCGVRSCRPAPPSRRPPSGLFSSWAFVAKCTYSDEHDVEAGAASPNRTADAPRTRMAVRPAGSRWRPAHSSRTSEAGYPDEARPKSTMRNTPPPASTSRAGPVITSSRPGTRHATFRGGSRGQGKKDEDPSTLATGRRVGAHRIVVYDRHRPRRQPGGEDQIHRRERRLPDGQREQQPCCQRLLHREDPEPGEPVSSKDRRKAKIRK